MAEPEMMLAGPACEGEGASRQAWKRTPLSRTPLTKGRSGESGWLGVVAAILEEEEDFVLVSAKNFKRTITITISN